ncbi:IS5 family transposase (plasmid) [Halarchaeum sp. CBA1220]|uniref:IS5/IS1182 family transposase n=1 Tax=Halarchaeum grantii TaxID=1193105 RepID=A0A830FCE4_9EURY|nr:MULTISPECIES: IS5 family transposase [Halarchaeum]QLC35407.1 IS5 family transposase [Halarchaeum sp. CBA1220]QLC35511.1 IS5 family transposase [Halarchaeum sp. CBA1220]QLC35698.1 IS5 family transposase [Halarchaeum sp. CBA1220]GGL40430.1 IS5/IS1182 family transposase [Halarchaeum grantii]
MQALPKSQLLRFVEQAYHLARRAVARYSSKFSKRRYTLHKHIVLLRLKVRKNTTYRTLLDELIEMPRIRSALGLEELPSPSTLCKAFNWLDMAVWRVLLNLSVTLLPTNGVVGIDASGFDRSHASKHYTKRTKLTIQQLKVTLLVDTRANAVLDVHVTTTRKHDSKIAPSLIKRNTGEVAVLLGDKGYDDQKIRALARETGVRPLIKHREFSSLHKAWNARLDADLYGQRSQNETVNSRLKRKYGAFVRSRHWWKQFRELVVCCLTHNIDKAL